MDERTHETITALLLRVEAGDSDADAKLYRIVYADLHENAVRCMRSQPASHTFHATDLVHEAYLKLFGSTKGRWSNRRHFLAVAAQAMRSILIDHARGRNRAKRRAPGERLALDTLAAGFGEREIDLLALDEALTVLAREDPRAARVVELRLFAGLEVEEVGRVLGIAKRAVERDWTFARLRLQRILRE
ncbi:MAG: ECF-type sigma factor [Planctomycetaceae bacterium]